LEKSLLIVTAILYLINFFVVITGNREKFSLFILWCAILTHFGLLACRSITAGHPPFTNFYETMLLLSFLIALRLVLWRRLVDDRFRWLSLLLIMTIVGSAFFLPTAMKTSRPLMPALNSFWMYIHVPAYLFGYMAIALAFIYALVFLFQGKSESSSAAVGLLKKMDSEVKIAFFFLNIGLVTGAIWGYNAWGNYWSWDTKEVWALINILTLGFYFHLLKPKGVKKALIVFLAFGSIIFTYLGVSFLLSGIHSYA
jgi:cytochrome c-type biogenesis protein CcsB